MKAKKYDSVRNQKARVLTGVLVVTFGTLYLLEKAQLNIPHWLVSWEMILIAGGFVALYKHHFKHFPGYMMIGFGGVFLINDFQPNTIDAKFIFPVIIILFGFSIIAKSMNLFGSSKKDHYVFDDTVDQSSDDFVTATTLFGGVKKSVVSKTFIGADLNTKFGGTEINLTQADIQQPVVINSNTKFGGLKIIVPSSWEVKTEIVAIFGSVEDKRAAFSEVTRDPNKVLILTGDCTFGGVEILSYA